MYKSEFVGDGGAEERGINTNHFHERKCDIIKNYDFVTFAAFCFLFIPQFLLNVLIKE